MTPREEPSRGNGNDRAWGEVSSLGQCVSVEATEVLELRDGSWRQVPVAERHPAGFTVTDHRRFR